MAMAGGSAHGLRRQRTRRTQGNRPRLGVRLQWPATKAVSPRVRLLQRPVEQGHWLGCGWPEPPDLAWLVGTLAGQSGDRLMASWQHNR